jgi:hypothetical protein
VLRSTSKLKVVVIGPDLERIVKSGQELMPILKSLGDCEHFTIPDLVVTLCFFDSLKDADRKAIGCQRESRSSHFCEMTPPVANPEASTSILVGRVGLQMAKTGVDVKAALSVSKAAY